APAEPATARARARADSGSDHAPAHRGPGAARARARVGGPPDARGLSAQSGSARAGRCRRWPRRSLAWVVSRLGDGRLDLTRGWAIIASVRRRSRSALLAVALVTSLAACSDAAGPEQPMSGEQLYNRQCARCHGLDGRPTKVSPTARDLTNRSYIDSLGNKGIRMAIMA